MESKKIIDRYVMNKKKVLLREITGLKGKIDEHTVLTDSQIKKVLLYE
jgi:hypothetical protein